MPRHDVERELAFLERSLVGFIDGPFVLDVPEAYLERAEVLLLDAAVANGAETRTNHYSDAAVAAALGALATALAARTRTPAGAELRFLIESLNRAEVGDPHERVAAVRAALAQAPMEIEEAFIDLAASAAAAAARR